MIFDCFVCKRPYRYYGRIRGVPESQLKGMVDLLIRQLTLDQDDQHRRPAGIFKPNNATAQDWINSGHLSLTPLFSMLLKQSKMNRERAPSVPSDNAPFKRDSFSCR